MPYESLAVLAAPVTIMGGALLKMWRDSNRTRELAEIANRRIEEHSRKCDEIPKSLLVEKIERVSEKVASADEDAKEFRKVIRAEFDRNADKIDNLTTIVLNRKSP